METQHHLINTQSPKKYAIKGNVLLGPNGKFVILKNDIVEIEEGYVKVCEYPHEDGDFSYCCGSDWCRCMQ